MTSVQNVQVQKSFLGPKIDKLKTKGRVGKRLGELLEDVVPRPVEIYLKYRADLREGRDKEAAKREARLRVGELCVKAGIALVTYRAAADTLGVGAWWNPNTTPNMGEIWQRDASPVAIAVASGAYSLMSPTTRDAMTDILPKVKVVTAFLRAYAESRIMRAVTGVAGGVVGSPQSTVLKPMFDLLAIELPFFYAISKPPVNEHERLMTAMVGIWGDIVRVATDLAVLGIVKLGQKVAKGLEEIKTQEN
ncbi:hypothetical protein HY990_05485 [Candidatus Micrarchaeota archaeon]|nr:hypothetical protein [Candidatus Micrarchaeota archaeon]